MRESISEAGRRAQAPVPTPTPQKTGIQGDASPWRERESRALAALPFPQSYRSPLKREGAGGIIVIER